VRARARKEAANRTQFGSGRAAPDVHRFERAANDAAGLSGRALMNVFGSFCIAHFLVVAGKCVVENDHNFCRLIVVKSRPFRVWESRGFLLKSMSAPRNQFEFLPPRFTCSGFSDFQNANSQFVNLVTKIVWLER
jgi:hypothetical protein